MYSAFYMDEMRTIKKTNVFFFFQVPPHQILVYDASGRDVSGAIGPLYEGDNLVLSCEVRGGKLIKCFFSLYNQYIIYV